MKKGVTHLTCREEVTENAQELRLSEPVPVTDPRMDFQVLI